jgi:pentose-5-phosphate-3-epimerase
MELLETHAATWNVRGVRVVLAALLHTPIERLVDAMQRTHTDDVLLMSIASPGQQGAPFDRHVLYHIRELKRLYPSARVTLDGGIHIETIGDAVAEGVDACIVGSHLINARDIQEVYDRLIVATQT